MNEIRISDLDVIFISYDEPQCEEFWAHTLRMVPWAKRVHRVTGFDAAHKQAANLAQTERFITIDGDNLIREEFLYKTIRIPPEYHAHMVTWGATNAVNGLVYGNGSLKCWTRRMVLEMRSHETASRDKSRVDFCWDIEYFHARGNYATTYPNGSPFQAFRSGFREGIKLLLDQGTRVAPDQMRIRLWEGNLRCLRVWASVGADIQNGLWCIYGARRAIEWMLRNQPHEVIADYDWFAKFWNEDVAPRFQGDQEYCFRTQFGWNRDVLISEIHRLGAYIGVLELDLELLSPEQSKLFKLCLGGDERNAIQVEI